ncbi:MAG: hypothetical protein JST85_27115 [Acidobacteria bacterium]|nr:hypothetical protein [Acidobacteriota bacterium]
MLKRLLLSQWIILAMVLTNLPGTAVRTVLAGRQDLSISSYEDDPFVRKSAVQRMDSTKFDYDQGEKPFLSSNQVSISNEDWIFRKDANGEFVKFAWNPWPFATANAQGDFLFQNEDRFPLFKQDRGPDGKIILKDGLQVWTPNDLHLGMTTAYSAAYAAKEAAESWAGRYLPWGQQGQLHIEPQVFIDFNAFYSPSARELFFGVVPYRLKNETAVKIFETASSWEMVAHECGHALHHILKPNTHHGLGFAYWGESFGDQTAMWTSLQDTQRVRTLLTETGGNLNQPNALSSLGESFAALVGTGTGIREAFNDDKVSDTSEEVHDRSTVLTGAAYKIFLKIYDELKPQRRPVAALQQAGEIMGIFLTRAADYTPENEMSLEDVAKAYLKVDRELFGGHYHNLLVDEFTRREIFDANSEHDWAVHEDSLPYLYLSSQMSESDIEAMLQGNVDVLRIGQDFGLKLQSVTRDERFNQTIVRAQLTMGRGEGAIPLNNHGVFVFRADGSLADYHAPVSPYASWQSPLQSESVQLRSLMSRAKRLGLDKHSAPLSIVRNADGQLTIESQVMRGEGLNTYMEVFSLKKPIGERREIMIPPLPTSKSLPIADDILN